MQRISHRGSMCLIRITASIASLVVGLLLFPALGLSKLALIVIALTMAVFMFVIQPSVDRLNHREIVYTSIYAFFLSLSTVIGFILSRYDALLTDHMPWFQILGVSILYTPAVFEVLALLVSQLTHRKVNANSHGESSPTRFFWIVFIVLLLCWIPVFLAFYPGIYAYDVISQARQCATGSYDTRNPLWHTLFLKLCFLIGDMLHSYTDGVGIGIGFQMIMIIAGIAKSLSLSLRLGMSKRQARVVLIYFALYPVLPIISISFIKDALFGVSFLLSLLYLYLYIRERNRTHINREIFLFGIFMGISVILRYNAVYAYGFGIFICLLFSKFFRNIFFITIVSLSVSCAFVMNAMLEKVLDATSIVGKISMFSIPAQQLRRAQRVAIDEQDKADIDSCFLKSVPDEVGYIPTFADIARFSLNTTVYGWNDTAVDIPVNSDYIIRTWLRMSIKYPIAYLEAFLQTNRGAWYLFDLSHAEIYGKPGNGVGYLFTTIDNTSKWYDVQRRSAFPKYAELLSSIFSDNEYQKIPGLGYLFGTGFQAWLFCFGVLLCIIKRNHNLMYVCLIPIGLWLTFMLGPCTLIRYFFPLLLFNPILISLTMGASLDVSDYSGLSGISADLPLNKEIQVKERTGLPKEVGHRNRMGKR